jgi:hypothetical protein
MTDTVDNAMPWLGENSDKNKSKAKSSATTPGGSRQTRWVVIGANLNPGEAMIIKGRLESEEIPAVIQQEAIGMVMGLTVGPLGSAKVLVPEPLAERAQAILAETFEVDEADIDSAETNNDER